MDPLSTAASGIAVVSLTIQLAGSVREIHRFLRSINEAPSELKRLIDLLEQLNCILDGFRDLQTKQKDQDGIPNMHAAVIRGLQDCQSKLELLASLVDKAKNRLNKSGKVSKTWASLKLTLKKKEMDEFESRLEQAMIGLQTAMVMNIAHMQVNHTQTTSILAREISSLRSSLVPVTELSDRPTESSLEARANAVKPSNINAARDSRQRQVAVTSSHTTLLGTFVYRTIYTYRNLTRNSPAVSKSKPVGHETVVTFIPSFFSYCVEMRLGNDYGKVSSSLTSYQVVKANDSLFEEGEWNGSPIFQACQLGDIEAMRSAFTYQGVSLYVVDENGNNLLHEAARSSQADVCRFLIEEGLNPNSGDWEGRVALMKIMYRTENKGLPALMETLEIIVSDSRTDLVSMTYLDYIGCLRCSPPQVFEYLLNQELVEICVKDFENWECLYILGMLLEKFGATQSEVWKRLIKKFVRMGVNYYDYSYRTSSLIDHCFLRCRDPIKSRAVADEWLEILSSTGVDLHDYLQMEMTRHPMKPPRICQSHYVDDRRRLIFSLEGTPTVHWEWWVHPREPGSLVVSEFGDLGRLMASDNSYSHNEWPYSRPDWLDYYQRCEDDSKVLKQANNRFERRMQKRAIKQYKAMGLESRKETYSAPRVPGAWIE